MAPLKNRWEALIRRTVQCGHCPRLRNHCQQIAHVKRRQYFKDTYWGRPIPGFGDPKATLWVLGLAPGAHGANRTGRVFTGDKSGDWLYRALNKTGWANQPESRSLDDGLVLSHAYVSCAVRCAPPDNKPNLQEIAKCSIYLDEEWQLLKHRKLILALGAIAFKATIDLIKRQKDHRKTLKFKHGAYYEIHDEKILCSYHPSQQNTQTGRLNWDMWLEIFEKARHIIDGSMGRTQL